MAHQMEIQPAFSRQNLCWHVPHILHMTLASNHQIAHGLCPHRSIMAIGRLVCADWQMTIVAQARDVHISGSSRILMQASMIRDASLVRSMSSGAPLTVEWRDMCNAHKSLTLSCPVLCRFQVICKPDPQNKDMSEARQALPIASSTSQLHRYCWLGCTLPHRGRPGLSMWQKPDACSELVARLDLHALIAPIVLA